MNKEYEYIVIGTGPGGAPAALELAKAGKKVLIIERGAYHRKLVGFPAGMLLSERLFMFNRSKEGVVMERGLTVGGSSMIYQGNVFEPKRSFLEEMGIDFSPEARDIKKEIGVRTLPDHFFNRNGNTGLARMMAAAEDMGAPFEEQEKFVDPEKCKLGCDWCMMGCPYDAKWTTRRYIDEAVALGAELRVSSPVDTLVFNANNNRVVGVQLKGGDKIMAPNIVLSAGGIGTAGILLRSGIKGAGKRFFMDPMVILYGLSKDEKGGQWGEQTFTHAVEAFADSDGFMIGNSGAWGTYCVMNLIRPKVMFQNWYKFPFVKRGMGLFVKLAEDDKGEIFPNERTSKPMTQNDIKRMDRGVDVARDIMIRGGAKEKSISLLKWAGGHPGGTYAMGEFVERDFSTAYGGLYVCDASVFPRSPGAPPSLSIMAMSRLLSKFLLGKTALKEREVKNSGNESVKGTA